MRRPRVMKAKSKDSGKLRIGDDWNAIRIIALSQSNPLKAIAEFVENSIDAQAKTITITRGREHGARHDRLAAAGARVLRTVEAAVIAAVALLGALAETALAEKRCTTEGTEHTEFHFGKQD